MGAHSQDLVRELDITSAVERERTPCNKFSCHTGARNHRHAMEHKSKWMGCERAVSGTRGRQNQQSHPRVCPVTLRYRAQGTGWHQQGTSWHQQGTG
eukprot:1155308-Pelagomonas_calceolata.AAC.5